MTKTLRKPVTMLLALCMVFSLSVGACADDITASGGSATSPVNLTTTNDGIGGGEGGGLEQGAGQRRIKGALERLHDHAGRHNVQHEIGHAFDGAIGQKFCFSAKKADGDQ